MKVNLEKAGIIASYFALNTKDLYVTKLLKLFYYVDFISYKQRGSSITNDIYYKLPYGPVPTLIKNELDNLILGESFFQTFGADYHPQFDAYIKLEPNSTNSARKVISRTVNPNLRKLSNYELDLIKKISEKFNSTKATVLSNQTHEEAPWKLSSDNSVINYELAGDLDVTQILGK